MKKEKKHSLQVSMAVKLCFMLSCHPVGGRIWRVYSGWLRSNTYMGPCNVLLTFTQIVHEFQSIVDNNQVWNQRQVHASFTIHWAWVATSPGWLEAGYGIAPQPVDPTKRGRDLWLFWTEQTPCNMTAV